MNDLSFNVSFVWLLAVANITDIQIKGKKTKKNKK